MKYFVLPLFACFFSILVSAQETHVIHFENKQWSPETWTPEQWNAPAPEEWIDGKFTRLIQFAQIPGEELLDQLPALGIELMAYYPEHTYLARLDERFDADIASNIGVIALCAVPAEVKMSKDILIGEIGDWALHGNLVDVVVRYYEDIDAEQLPALFSEISNYRIFADYGILKGQTDINQLYDLAANPALFYLSIESEPGEPEDVEGRSLHRTNQINSLRENGLRYNADGVGLQIRDDGFLGPHIDYHGRMELNAFGQINTDHMDMVAGIAGGAGNLNPRIEGMASAATMYATNYQADFLDRTLSLHQEEGVLVTNSSYSNGCNAGYTSITETVDRQIHENPTLIHVFSAGNSNGNSCGNNAYGAGAQWANITGGHKVGKNVIATANLRLDVSLENSSSRGPAHDGRLKPDLAARGTAQLSTDPNNGYSPGGGTSAASPGVAGTCAQLFHAYRDLNGGETPPSALIKASLMNTANDLGNPGPDFLFGFGHINAGRAFKLLEEKRYLMESVDHGNTAQHVFDVPDGVHEVRFMLYWSEPPAAPNSGRALVNNLDLKVEHEGNEFLPLVLDPTPNEAALSKTAEPGIDNLNNVEQVVFKKPTAGQYTVNVNGTALPFGSKDYIVLIEMITDEIELTYPYGGEGWEPGTTEQIHWNATDGTESFTIDYSADGGQNWDNLGVTSGNARIFSWNIPNDQEITSQGKIRITRGSVSSENEEAFSMALVPERLSIVKACSDYVELEWLAMPDAKSYDVYMLGEKFMEIVANVDTNYAQIPVEDVLAEHWFSVRTIHTNDAVSRRMNAIPLTRGVFNCDVVNDVSLESILTPVDALTFSCGAYNSPVSVNVRNNGDEVVTEIDLEYVIENVTMGSEKFTVNLNPGQQTVLTMASPLQIDDSGNYDLQVVISSPGDELPGNDGITINMEFLNFDEDGMATPFQEGFETGGFPPEDWTIRGDYLGAQWNRQAVRGPDGLLTQAMHLGMQSNAEVYLQDAIYSRSIDLSQTTDASLAFDYAVHINDPARYGGKIDVLVYSFCDEEQVETIFSSSLDGLRTSETGAQYPWIPNGSNDWERVILDLSPFEGSEIVVSWVVTNDVLFNVYIDNINIETSTVDIPNLEFEVSNTTPCATFEVVTFEVLNPEQGVDYSWQFSERSAPKDAIGPGPHNVRFFDDGEFEVVVIASNNSNGATAQRTIDITAYQRPSANFDFSVVDKEVTFENKSSRAISYMWDFGDGNTSTEPNPVHTYLSNGTYEVILTATNECTSRTSSEMVQVGPTSSTDLSLDDVEVYPNPMSESVLIYNPTTKKMDYSITDLSGKTWSTGILNEGTTKIISDTWPSGSYVVHLSNGNVFKALKLVKLP